MGDGKNKREILGLPPFRGHTLPGPNMTHTRLAKWIGPKWIGPNWPGQNQLGPKRIAQSRSQPFVLGHCGWPMQFWANPFLAAIWPAISGQSRCVCLCVCLVCLCVCLCLCVSVFDATFTRSGSVPNGRRKLTGQLTLHSSQGLVPCGRQDCRSGVSGRQDCLLVVFDHKRGWKGIQTQTTNHRFPV